MYSRIGAIKGLKYALEILADCNFVFVTNCGECKHWKANNTEEGDSSGVCQNSYGICKGLTTDSGWFCQDGEVSGDAVDIYR